MGKSSRNGSCSSHHQAAKLHPTSRDDLFRAPPPQAFGRCSGAATSPGGRNRPAADLDGQVSPLPGFLMGFRALMVVEWDLMGFSLR